MNINKLIIDTLAPLNVPVEFHSYNGDEPTYITFFEYNQRGALHGDDKELKTALFLQVDVFSKSDYTTLVEEVKHLLGEIGFTRSSEHGNYNEVTGFYQKAISFNYVE